MIAPPTVHLFKSCFHEVDGKASYDTDCSNNVIDAAQAAQAHVDAEVASEATDSESTGSDEVVEEGVQEEL